jgi:serine/threonine protein kinase
MKVLKKEEISEKQQEVHTKAEREILEKIKNPFIVNLHYAFQTPDKLYFILDFVNGGELFSHLRREKKFPEYRAKFYAAEIVLALE